MTTELERLAQAQRVYEQGVARSSEIMTTLAAQRDALIRGAREAGHTWPEVAAATGLTRQRCAQLIAPVEVSPQTAELRERLAGLREEQRVLEAAHLTAVAEVRGRQRSLVRDLLSNPHHGVGRGEVARWMGMDLEHLNAWLAPGRPA